MYGQRRIGKHENFGRELVFSADLCYNSVDDANG